MSSVEIAGMKHQQQLTLLQGTAAASHLFAADYTCISCHIRQRDAHALVHPILGEKRPVVLCSKCAEKHPIPEDVQAMRQEWLALVARSRLRFLLTTEGATPSVALVSQITDVLRDKDEPGLLAFVYHMCGSSELRDKYIGLAIANHPLPAEEIWLRQLQGRVEEVAEVRIQQEIDRYERNQSWASLARLHAARGQWERALQYYCRAITRALEEQDLYGAATALRELHELRAAEALLESALRDASDRGDFRREVRYLDELVWRDELTEYISNHELLVRRSGDLMVHYLFANAKGNQGRLQDLRNQILASLDTAWK